ncbi:hypothetical protein GCM10010253_09500 [Streptomyces badius]|uniref:Uncharacterized protein n=1 Tax=Streptomyces badius TaxID=1941 RepID=A0ABQ2SRI3_STRBA|nr:hypothetical protein GCM10010253_09500 [Streptomyces badius]
MIFDRGDERADSGAESGDGMGSTSSGGAARLSIRQCTDTHVYRYANVSVHWRIDTAWIDRTGPSANASHPRGHG